MPQITIQLLNQSNIFFPGHLVQGTLTLILKQDEGELRTGGLFVTCEGHADVHFTTSRTVSDGKGGSKTETVHHYGSETYYENVITLFGGSGTVQKIRPGIYTYPFQFQLPSFGLPPTVPADGIGAIEYSIIGKFNQKPWYKFDTRTKIPFYVYAHVDLNAIPALRNPVHVMNQKTICCLCCASGPIIMTIGIPKAGYVPGEIMPLILEVNNNSSRDLTTTFGICQLTNYFAEGLVRSIENKFIELQGPPVPGKTCEVWSPIVIIPALPPSPSLSGCNIIELHYSLCAEVHVPRGFNLKCKAPIEIGTIPLLAVADASVPAIVANPIESMGTTEKNMANTASVPAIVGNPIESLGTTDKNMANKT